MVNFFFTDVRQRASIKPTVPVVSPNLGPLENGNHQVQTPVRGGPTRLAGR